MTVETVEIPAFLWNDIKDKLAPMARRLADAKGGFDAFPDLYATLNAIRDHDEFSSSSMDEEIFGVPSREPKAVPSQEMAEVLTEAVNVMADSKTEEPDYLIGAPAEIKAYHEGLPNWVKEELNAADKNDKPFSTNALFEAAPETPVVEETGYRIETLREACAALHILFDKAKEKGAKRIIYRSPVLTLSLAPATGSNPGLIYIKDAKGEYVGKMTRSEVKTPFQKQSHLSQAEYTAALIDIANDPEAVAVRYGRLTGTCCLCGAELTDPESIANGIGPICATKFGW